LPNFRPGLLLCLLLALLTFGAYWPVRNHDFIFYDDPQFVTDNPQIQSGLNWQTLHYAFSKPVVGNWHPVTVLSHALDCQLFGVRPRAHHLVNVVFHGLNAALLFLLLQNLTGAVWRSGLVAGIFALHPLRVESVAWVAERKDLLAGLFFLLTLWLYAKYVRESGNRKSAEAKTEARKAERPGARRTFYWASLLCFALALMSKPMVVTLPCVLLLLDYWPLQRLDSVHPFSATTGLSRLLLEKVPFFLLALIDSLITFSFQKSAGATQVIGQSTWPGRLANALTSYVRYLGDLLWPARLAIIYPHPARHYYLSDQWPAWEVICAGALLVLVSILFLRLAPRRPYFVIGWFWFVGMLIPVIGLVQAGEQAMADRYTYLPLIGPAFALVWWLGDEMRRWWPKVTPQITAGAALVLVATLFALTRHQLSYWQNTLSLFTHAAEVTADNASAQFGIGMGLLEQGQPSQAMVRFRVALAIDPSYVRAHYIMGQLLRVQRNWQAAADEYQAALRANPSDVRARVNLAGVLPALGRAREAYEHLDQAVRLDPNAVEALNNFAWLLATSADADLRDGGRAVQLGERACALTHFKQAAFIGTLAAAYAEAGNFPQAIATAQHAAEVATAAGDTALATRNQQLINLYRAGKPYRESSQRPQARQTPPRN